ncbi:MAG: NAD(P)/FAD-dependent oxidoreductase [Xenococcaceae cyanobacterium]
MVPPEYDVVVIGAGAGGTATAIHCAKTGLKVAILERQEFPRHRPGETLHPGIEPLLDRLGVGEQIRAANFLRHEGNWVNWGEERGFIPFGSDKRGIWRGFQAPRADFDAILLHRVRELGVEIKQPCRALGLLQEQGRVIGVKTSQGEIQASFVVDAGGGFHWLARQLKLEIQKLSPPLIAYYGYVEGYCPKRDDTPAIVADKQGWTWTARVGPHLYQWTRLPLDGKQLDRNWCPKEFLGLAPKGEILKEDVTWRAISQPSGNRYFAVGDAAFVLDPASSHGVLKAIMSGIMAGHGIVKILRFGQSEYMVTNGYCQWILTWFRKDLEELRKFYLRLPNPPNWISH